jgi:hypothetical protein
MEDPPRSSGKSARLLKIRINSAVLRVVDNMPDTSTPSRACLAELYVTYETLWQRFSQEVDRWRSFLDSAESSPELIRQAELAIESAEQEYRQARNALAAYLLEHSAAHRFFVKF